jgi:UDP-glucose 4-epimerase
MKILITGGNGFLGSHCAKRYAQLGHEVFGLGHGKMDATEAKSKGFDTWMTGSVTYANLVELGCIPDIVIHCGGSGSVGFSVQFPYLDFQKTVDCTGAILEYVRAFAPHAKIIYPSSPAVQGVHDDSPIFVNDARNPAAPYGVHKKMAEELCESYVKYFHLNVIIIRFFSIYGPGLQKQLIWDACTKMAHNPSVAEFWGTGQETRDWVHVSDAVDLIEKCSFSEIKSDVVNCGSGSKKTIAETLETLKKHLKIQTQIVFNGQKKVGDPEFYWADLTETHKYKWAANICLDNGFTEYAEWFRQK